MKEYNLIEDIWRDDEILNKIRTRDDYAQNLYAALCNMQYCPRDLWPILKEEYWSCSWRAAGGLVSDFIGKGDYMDWYCSGMGGFAALSDDQEHDAQAEFAAKKYVPEGTVTDEIESDFNRIGWIPVPWPKDKH
jgi:hypothetical protein